jgi:hypothetical protein
LRVGDSVGMSRGRGCPGETPALQPAGRQRYFATFFFVAVLV